MTRPAAAATPAGAARLSIVLPAGAAASTSAVLVHGAGSPVVTARLAAAPVYGHGSPVVLGTIAGSGAVDPAYGLVSAWSSTVVVGSAVATWGAGSPVVARAVGA